jgi:hypothetical protein
MVAEQVSVMGSFAFTGEEISRTRGRPLYDPVQARRELTPGMTAAP